jgi:hypothetical protein
VLWSRFAILFFKSLRPFLFFVFSYLERLSNVSIYVFKLQLLLEKCQKVLLLRKNGNFCKKKKVI